jgi:glycosyltransferase involved in cell wall biosynthesis
MLLLSPGEFAEGGAERSATLLVAYMLKHGHEVRVLGLPGSALSGFGAVGADIAELPSTTAENRPLRHSSAGRFAFEALLASPRVTRAATAIHRELRLHRPDVIYSNGARTHLLSAAVPTRVPLVWALRDVPPRPAQVRLLRTATRRVALLLANSEFTRSQYRGLRVRSEVVGNPVAPVPRSDMAIARRHLGLPLRRPIIALVAHLHPSKGHNAALEALAHFDLADRPLLAVAGGANYPGSHDYRQALLARARGLSVGDDVVLLGNLADVAPLYSAADVLVHPPVHPEGFGRTVIEAHSAGLPVVATRLGGVAELCRDRETALLVPPNDACALSAAVREILGSAELRARLVAGGAETASRFLPEAHVTLVEGLLGEVSRK